MKNFSKQLFWCQCLVTSHFLLVEMNFTYASSAALGLLYHALCMFLCLRVQLFIKPSTHTFFPLPRAQGPTGAVHQLKPSITTTSSPRCEPAAWPSSGHCWLLPEIPKSMCLLASLPQTLGKQRSPALDLLMDAQKCHLPWGSLTTLPPLKQVLWAAQCNP